MDNMEILVKKEWVKASHVMESNEGDVFETESGESITIASADKSTHVRTIGKPKRKRKPVQFLHNPEKAAAAEEEEDPEMPDDEAPKTRSKKAKTTRQKKRKTPDSVEKVGDVEALGKTSASEGKPIPKGDIPDIGCEVLVKKKNGKWYKGTLVKHDRWGRSKMYAVKTLVCVLDHGAGTERHQIPTKDVLLTGKTREVRYWSSGTPCMRSSGFDYARKTAAEQAKANEQKNVRLKTKVEYAGPESIRRGMQSAQAKAQEILGSIKGTKKKITDAHVMSVFDEMGDNWPTQARPNVTRTGKPVPGICLGAVHVLGGIGMQCSNVTLAFPELSKFILEWIKTSLPEKDFPFSSVQINYNYMAKRHVDGNNIGPSYIKSLGAHEGGELWIADTYIEERSEDGSSSRMRGGGGEGYLQCKNKWVLFDGNAEHETQPVRPCKGKDSFTRISFIVFSNSSYNNLPKYVVDDLKGLGFTAASSDGEDLPYFKKYRIDKKEFTSNQNKTYFEYQMQRAEEKPIKTKPGSVSIECYGLTMARGGGWLAFQGGKDKETEPTILDLEPNRTGFHVLELELMPDGSLRQVSFHTERDRFNIYKDTDKETNRFCRWVDSLPNGRIVLITITDTAIAKSRPPTVALYKALQKLGGSTDMERIGYRMPFAMIGVKGLKPGSALHALDKTKILLRMEATVTKKGKAIILEDQDCERTDIAALMLEDDGN